MANFKYTDAEALNARVAALEAEVKTITDGGGQMLTGKGLKKGEIVRPIDVVINKVSASEGKSNGVFLIKWNNGATCGAKWFDVEQTAKALMEWVAKYSETDFEVTKAKKGKGSIDANGVKSEDYAPSEYEFEYEKIDD